MTGRAPDGTRLTGGEPGRMVGQIGPVVGAALEELEGILAAGGVREARQEARDIVAVLLDQPRFWPAVNREARLAPEVIEAGRAAAHKRAGGAPFAYAVGRAAFRHLTLDLDESVLIPRQETEQLVELVLERVEGGTIVDVGTGSGAIALALASEGAYERVFGTDVSLDALAVARRNAELLAGAMRVPVEFRHGSLLAPVREQRLRAVVSNPPYIAYEESRSLPPSVRDWEPAVALYSGEGGMAATAEIVREAAPLLEPGGLLAFEVDVRRAALVAEVVVAHGSYCDVEIRLDLTGRERFVLARRR